MWILNAQWYIIGAGAVICGLMLLALLVVGLLARRADKRKGAPWGVWAVLGRPGAGKTYFMTREAVYASRRGRRIVANYDLDLPNFVRIDSWAELLGKCEQGDLVLIDEAHLWWPSSAFRAPPEVRAWLAQVRKRDVSLFWSGQSWDRVSKGLRHLTRGVWVGRGVAGGHRYRLYDGGEYGRRGAKPLRNLTLKREKAVERAYDTRELLEGACTWDDA